MKKNTLAAAVIAALTISMSGCALLQPDKSPAVQFNYTAQDAKDAAQAGLVRAFDMNGNTVLQFSIQSSRPKIFDTGNPASISYQVIGQYAVLPGVHQSLLIKTATASIVAHQDGHRRRGSPARLIGDQGDSRRRSQSQRPV